MNHPALPDLRPRRFPAAFLPAALLLTGLLLGAPAMSVGTASAQVTFEPEVRWGAVVNLQGTPELRTARGDGWGVRVRGWRGIGIGVESDQTERTRLFLRELCPSESTAGCTFEDADLTSEMDFTTLLVFLDASPSDDLRFRFGLGRAAGVITGRGVVRSTGETFSPPAADAGRGRLAWSRGADGSVLMMEAVWNAPLPGPVRLGALAAVRQRNVTMDGCRSGSVSPYCGRLNQTSFMLGARLALRVYPSASASAR